MIFLAGSTIKSERYGFWRLEVGGAGDDSAVCPAERKSLRQKAGQKRARRSTTWEHPPSHGHPLQRGIAKP